MEFLSTEPVSCPECYHLRRKFEDLQKQHTTDYMLLRKRIISTSSLIKRYKTVSEQKDAILDQCNKLKDLVKLLQKDCKKYEAEIAEKFRNMEPLRQENEKFQKMGIENSKTINFLQCQHEASEKLNEQLNECVKLKEKNEEKLEEKIIELKKELRKKHDADSDNNDRQKQLMVKLIKFFKRTSKFISKKNLPNKESSLLRLSSSIKKSILNENIEYDSSSEDEEVEHHFGGERLENLLLGDSLINEDSSDESSFVPVSEHPQEIRCLKPKLPAASKKDSIQDSNFSQLSSNELKLNNKKKSFVGGNLNKTIENEIANGSKNHVVKKRKRVELCAEDENAKSKLSKVRCSLTMNCTEKNASPEKTTDNINYNFTIDSIDKDKSTKNIKDIGELSQNTNKNNNISESYDSLFDHFNSNILEKSETVVEDPSCDEIFYPAEKFNGSKDKPVEAEFNGVVNSSHTKLSKNIMSSIKNISETLDISELELDSSLDCYQSLPFMIDNIEECFSSVLDNSNDEEDAKLGSQSSKHNDACSEKNTMLDVRLTNKDKEMTNDLDSPKTDMECRNTDQFISALEDEIETEVDNFKDNFHSEVNGQSCDQLTTCDTAFERTESQVCTDHKVMQCKENLKDEIAELSSEIKKFNDSSDYKRENKQNANSIAELKNLNENLSYDEKLIRKTTYDEPKDSASKFSPIDSEVIDKSHAQFEICDRMNEKQPLVNLIQGKGNDATNPSNVSIGFNDFNDKEKTSEHKTDEELLFSLKCQEMKSIHPPSSSVVNADSGSDDLSPTDGLKESDKCSEPLNSCNVRLEKQELQAVVIHGQAQSEANFKTRKVELSVNSCNNKPENRIEMPELESNRQGALSPTFQPSAVYSDEFFPEDENLVENFVGVSEKDSSQFESVKNSNLNIFSQSILRNESASVQCSTKQSKFVGESSSISSQNQTKKANSTSSHDLSENINKSIETTSKMSVMTAFETNFSSLAGDDNSKLLPDLKSDVSKHSTSYGNKINATHKAADSIDLQISSNDFNKNGHRCDKTKKLVSQLSQRTISQNSFNKIELGIKSSNNSIESPSIQKNSSEPSMTAISRYSAQSEKQNASNPADRGVQIEKKKAINSDKRANINNKVMDVDKATTRIKLLKQKISAHDILKIMQLPAHLLRPISPIVELTPPNEKLTKNKLLASSQKQIDKVLFGDSSDED